MYSLALVPLLSVTALAAVIPRAPSAISTAKIPIKNDQGNTLVVAGSLIRYAVVGIGTQNYTCDSSNTVVSKGATAHLYDVSSQADSQDADAFASWLASQTLDAYHNYPTPPSAVGSEIGQHYFSPDPSAAAGLPTFNFGADFIRARSVATIPANDVGVPTIVWVRLDEAGDSSDSLTGGHAFRVETVGGATSLVICGDESTYQQPYAAGYFITGA